jgi:NAD(P)-dependent dehydrogenase (short-subunit alcohol dehydrogenase family)
MANPSTKPIRVIEETPGYWRAVFDYPHFNVVDGDVFQALQDLLVRMETTDTPTSSQRYSVCPTCERSSKIADVEFSSHQKAAEHALVSYTKTERGNRKMTTDTSIALITGGTSGIGRATANKLAQLGIHVFVVGRNAERGEKAVVEIRGAGGRADFISSDLRDASSAREVAKRALELGDGHVDILINNAGIFPFGPTDKTTEEEFDRVYSLNVKTPYFLVAELAPLMAKRGKGAIVNVSTMVADYGVSGMSLYGSSKAAINLLTKSWAAEYGPSGVRVNAVSPGPTRTEGTEAMGEGVEQLAAQAPAGRPATADEIAEAIVFLATDRSSFIYGAKLAVDGGRTAV